LVTLENRKKNSKERSGRGWGELGEGKIVKKKGKKKK